MRFRCVLFSFFFKQKTAYDLRISDWSSDVCSSDLIGQKGLGGLRAKGFVPAFGKLADLGVEIGAAAVPVVHAVRVEPEGEQLLRQIGRASCRERVCQYVYISVVAVSFTTKERQ